MSTPDDSKIDYVNEYFEGSVEYRWDYNITGPRIKVFYAYPDLKAYLKVLSYIVDGQNIQAIREHRAVTGDLLRPSRDFIYDIRVREIQALKSGLDIELKKAFPEHWL